MIRSQALRLAVLALVSTFAVGQSNREHFEHATVSYDWVTNSRGEKLRTFITRPNRSGKVPVIFFVGWLSCDTMEYPDPNTMDGFGILIRRLIDESGYATVRMDKSGVGESQGKCANADFRSEMEGWQAAFDAMSKYDFIDRDRVIVLGMSNGGGFSPLAARDHPVRGFVSCGSWGRTWYEHMLELERRRLTQAGKSPAEVTTAVKAFTEFYELYLIKGLTPGQVIGQHPEWKSLWYDTPDGQYGRPAAFYQQLQALNLGEVWQNVSAPVLVIRGGADTIMSRGDSEAIAQIVNQSHPGNARYLEIERMEHGFTVDGKFYDPLIPTMLEWMKQQLGAK
ncbi:MAG: alpha/beta hydrolase [Acidobacteria bacterium]|nr:alpha/beta hydrolase [Acidobacteriota bacterium]